MTKTFFLTVCFLFGFLFVLSLLNPGCNTYEPYPQDAGVIDSAVD